MLRPRGCHDSAFDGKTNKHATSAVKVSVHSYSCNVTWRGEGNSGKMKAEDGVDEEGQAHLYFLQLSVVL